jgi:hypothetical protein
MYCLFRNEKITLTKKEENLELYSLFNQYVCKKIRILKIDGN